jgi:16S rRNA (guanine527-N7)-methyltransferase
VPGVPAAPPEALALFGPALPVAERYARLLAGPGVERGLIGPDEAARLWPRHLINCAVVAELVPRPATLADLGSGAGLPGIVLAMLLPDVEVTLVEPMARRVVFLTECIAALGLGNVLVRRGRAEDMAGQIMADVVTARAVAPLERLAGLASALARPGGLVLAIKGAGAADELARAQPVLRRLGAEDVGLVQAGSGSAGRAATVVRFRTAPGRGRSARPERAGGARRKSAATGGRGPGSNADRSQNSRKGRDSGRSGVG